MKTQKSFENKKSSLYLVATPIGNLEEMTPRAISSLKMVDVIAAEDTRNTKNLLNHFSITTPLISYHMHNEESSTQSILNMLKENKNVALVSDAGYPLISDPGSLLVRKALEKGYNVIPISGSSAFLNALVASGLSTQPFTFLGFLEAKESKLKTQLEKVKNVDHTLIFYMSVHKVMTSLKVIKEVLGNRSVVIAREITKLHEEFIRGNLDDILASDITLKGEFVLIIEGYIHKEEMDIELLLKKVQNEIENGLSASYAINKIAKEMKVSKNKLYKAYQTHKESL